jgi:hypothetical protein
MNVASLSSGVLAATTPSPRQPGSSPADVQPPEPRPLRAPQAISQAGEAFGRLAGLRQSDPEALKSTAADIAGALREASGKSAGDAGADSRQARGRLRHRLADGRPSAALGPPGGEGPGRMPPPGPAQYARQANGGAEVQALQQAMSVVASKLGVV